MLSLALKWLATQTYFVKADKTVFEWVPIYFNFTINNISVFSNQYFDLNTLISFAVLGFVII